MSGAPNGKYEHTAEQKNHKEFRSFKRSSPFASETEGNICKQNESGMKELSRLAFVFGDGRYFRLG